MAGAWRVAKLVCRVMPNMAVLPRSQAACRSTESPALNTRPRLMGESCTWLLLWGSFW
ncbi:hypothetical protein D9M69_723370 [compost metagenome]